MPRPILGVTGTQTPPLGVGASPATGVVATADLRARLRTARSSTYMQVIASALDAGGYVDDRSRVAALMQALEKEFPELALASFPRGIVARCYLGEPYEVHTLDLVLGQIITHYKRGQGLPDGLERARSLALHPDYAFVEVYADELRPVRADGAVTVVNAGSSEGL